MPLRAGPTGLRRANSHIILLGITHPCGPARLDRGREKAGTEQEWGDKSGPGCTRLRRGAGKVSPRQRPEPRRTPARDPLRLLPRELPPRRRDPAPEFAALLVVHQFVVVALLQTPKPFVVGDVGDRLRDVLRAAPPGRITWCVQHTLGGPVPWVEGASTPALARRRRAAPRLPRRVCPAPPPTPPAPAPGSPPEPPGPTYFLRLAGQPC